MPVSASNTEGVLTVQTGKFREYLKAPYGGCLFFKSHIWLQQNTSQERQSKCNRSLIKTKAEVAYCRRVLKKDEPACFCSPLNRRKMGGKSLLPTQRC